MKKYFLHDYHSLQKMWEKMKNHNKFKITTNVKFWENLKLINSALQKIPKNSSLTGLRLCKNFLLPIRPTNPASHDGRHFRGLLGSRVDPFGTIFHSWGWIFPLREKYGPGNRLDFKTWPRNGQFGTGSRKSKENWSKRSHARNHVGSFDRTDTERQGKVCRKYMCKIHIYAN